MKPIRGRGSLIICGLVLLGCNGSPTEPSEAGESGTQHQVGDTARETRAGLDARGQQFSTWSVHVELGSAAG